MNTEQLKTAEELEQTLETICFSAYIHGKNQGDTFHGWYTESGHKSGIEKVVKDFASQESNRAVSEFKEKLKQELQYKAIQKLTSKTIRRKVYVFERLDLKEIVYLIDKL